MTTILSFFVQLQDTEDIAIESKNATYFRRRWANHELKMLWHRTALVLNAAIIQIPANSPISNRQQSWKSTNPQTPSNPPKIPTPPREWASPKMATARFAHTTRYLRANLNPEISLSMASRSTFRPLKRPTYRNRFSENVSLLNCSRYVPSTYFTVYIIL